jgi:hypothetical protein
LRLGLCALLVAGSTVSALAAEREFMPWSSAESILAGQGIKLPADLENANEGAWNTWSRKQDKAVRARLEQGDLDSMVNLLLFGTSFTRQPRIGIENITEAARKGVLRARVDDLIAGLRNPGGNERLAFLNTLMRSRGLDPNGSSADLGVFVYSNLERVLRERQTLAARAAEARRDADSVLDRSSLFRDRGVSLDTSIFPDFSIEQTLRDLKTRGVLGEGQVSRVAVIGPGLDFIDKNEESAYDYYPPQTVQPFALYDSLARLELSKPGALSVAILDISAQVLDHVKRARERARRNLGYVIQLPRDVARPWPPDVISYWRALGDRTGTAVAPIPAPEIFKGLETRAVRIRPDVVLACEPLDLDIVLERLKLPQAERFDLVIGTNIFLYYDNFQQLLALENIGAMLKPGGLLLTNDKLPQRPESSMRQAGMTVVRYNGADPGAIEAMGWYRKN